MYWWCEFSLCWGSLHLLLQEWSCYLFCGVSASYSLPEKVIADCKPLPVQCFTEAVDLYSFTFSVLLQWGLCWFLLWYLEGAKSIISPFGHSYIICMVIPFSKWNSMSPKKLSITLCLWVFWFVRFWQWRFPVMLQFASQIMPDLTATCISQFGRHRHSKSQYVT